MNPATENLVVFSANLGWHLFLYFTAAGVGYWVFHVFFRHRLAARRIRPQPAPVSAMRRDILYSLSSVVIFALVGLLIHHAALQGWTKLYLRIDRHGWGYFWFSLVAMILIHDT